MGILFQFFYPPFILEYGPVNISLSLGRGVVPHHARTHICVQSWSTLLPLICVGSAFHARVPRATQIAHVTGRGGGVGGGGKIKLCGRLCENYFCAEFIPPVPEWNLTPSWDRAPTKD